MVISSYLVIPSYLVIVSYLVIPSYVVFPSCLVIPTIRSKNYETFHILIRFRSFPPPPSRVGNVEKKVELSNSLYNHVFNIVVGEGAIALLPQ